MALAVGQLGIDRREPLVDRIGGALAPSLGLVRPQRFEIITDDPPLGAAPLEGCLVGVGHLLGSALRCHECSVRSTGFLANRARSKSRPKRQSYRPRAIDWSSVEIGSDLLGDQVEMVEIGEVEHLEVEPIGTGGVPCPERGGDFRQACRRRRSRAARRRRARSPPPAAEPPPRSRRNRAPAPPTRSSTQDRGRSIRRPGRPWRSDRETRRSWRTAG